MEAQETLIFFCDYVIGTFIIFWTADVIDNETSTELISGMPLVPGINLLGQYEYLNIGSAYIMATEPTDLQQPDNYTLGGTWVLVWGDSDE